MQNVGPGKRIAYTVLDVALYSTVTMLLASLFGWSPVVDFMGAYTPEQKDEYWGMFWLAMLIVSAGSLASHSLRGQSIGKWMFGAKSVCLDGSPLGIGGACRRIVYIWATMLLIFVPGPLVGFIFGRAGNLVSVILLWIAVLITLIVAVRPWHADRSPLLQPYFGVRTINVE